MIADRGLLDGLANDALGGKELRIETDQREARVYTLRRLLGKGKTGVAWEAVDNLDRTWAVKFVLRDDYRTHSLAAEATRVAKLKTRSLAHIEFYGKPTIAPATLDLQPFYAIVVEWISGQTLKRHLTEASTLTVGEFLRIARALCEVVAALRQHGLCHNDLHDENVIVSPALNPLTLQQQLEAVVIDTGTLKTEERRLELLEMWRKAKEQLEQTSTESGQDLSPQIARIERWIKWVDRSDQEWVVCHLCALSNALLRRIEAQDAPTKRFLLRLPTVLDRMIDPDLGRRLADPALMYKELETLWSEANQPGQPKMGSPFDFMSAELIRSDRQLLALFSVEFPGLQECQTGDPIYLYGPRGCGKSTILRAISLKAILSLPNPEDELRSLPFIGIYLACSAELRSRFWLIKENDYDHIEPHVVRFFNLLLLEQLVDTLDAMYAWDRDHQDAILFGMGADQADVICQRVRCRLEIPEVPGRYRGTSAYAVLKLQIRKKRDQLWGQILDREAPASRTDAQLVFDVCHDLSECSPFFQQRQVAFLLDDYSKQRIPVGLQRRLNQAITFAKQGNPIFKVTSEYGGVDLAGIQEGREVREVNVGLQYVDLAEPGRWRFLKNVLEKRFKYLGKEIDLQTILPFSDMGPALPMAKELKRCFQERKDFYYHGLDTISDLCSGDFAMGLDLVRRIFDRAEVPWQAPRLITPPDQDSAIRRFASQEFEYLRYLAPYGSQKHAVADALCWLAKESVITRTTTREGETIPLIKIHIDVAEPVLAQLETEGGQSFEIFNSLVEKGILFPIDTSRSRQARQGTRRYQIRRILLSRYGAPLGRHTPIRIDEYEKMRFLLTEPREFVKHELGRAANETQPDLFGGRL